MTAMSSSARLHVQGVRKAFGPTLALAGVDLLAAPGEVHAVIGENGAGKSTLMAILGGDTRADSGGITLDGVPYAPKNPRDARDAGIAIVHQELSLCAHLSVTENVMLGVEPARLGLLKRNEMRARVAATLKIVLGNRPSPITPDTRVGDLGPADQQLVEIARALGQTERGCRMLILDEPTSSLAKDDVERLFALVRTLKAAKVTVLYISHFLEEIAQIADRFTVLRDGRAIASGDPRTTTAGEIIRMMAGRKVEQLYPRTLRNPGAVILTVDNLAGGAKLDAASLVLRRGEVMGIAGLLGAGRTELFRALFGLEKVRSGKITVGTYAGPASPRERLAHGMGMVSEDRKREGLATGLSIADNVTLSKMPMWVSPASQRVAAQRQIDELSIRCRSPEDLASSLSGGNQQKVALARLLHHDVDVWLLDEPTRGIDVASKAQIYGLIDGLAARGKALLVVSSQLPELLGTCDRIAVMRRGRLHQAKPVGDWTEHALLEEAAGALL